MPYCHPGGVHLIIGGGREWSVVSRKAATGRFRQPGSADTVHRAEHLGRPLEEKPRRDPAITRLKHGRSRSVRARLRVSEALYDFKLRVAEAREALSATVLERRHRFDLLRRSHGRADCGGSPSRSPLPVDSCSPRAKHPFISGISARRSRAGLGAELRCGPAARRLLLGPYTWSSVFQFEGTAPAGPGTG